MIAWLLEDWPNHISGLIWHKSSANIFDLSLSAEDKTMSLNIGFIIWFQNRSTERTFVLPHCWLCSWRLLNLRTLHQTWRWSFENNPRIRFRFGQVLHRKRIKWQRMAWGEPHGGGQPLQVENSYWRSARIHFQSRELCREASLQLSALFRRHPVHRVLRRPWFGRPSRPPALLDPSIRWVHRLHQFLPRKYSLHQTASHQIGWSAKRLPECLSFFGYLFIGCAMHQSLHPRNLWLLYNTLRGWMVLVASNLDYPSRLLVHHP